ncbi:unnamed protein product [Gulo gulo]|uniref:Uncharacterized protein n=1 Tax=Gulo gulo TaxID=48420 RepID=A0A9X9LVM4_GULGU|nr:unnamed protein product [Gulo gulo]
MSGGSSCSQTPNRSIPIVAWWSSTSAAYSCCGGATVLSPPPPLLRSSVPAREVPGSSTK